MTKPSVQLPPAQGQTLKQVEVFQATIKTQSGKVFSVLCPADMTDADLLDFIMSAANNLSEVGRRRSTKSLLQVASPTLVAQ